MTDEELREIEEAVRSRQAKDGMTRWHQRVSTFGIPAALAVLGWIAIQFTGMQQDVAALKDHVVSMDERLNAQASAIGKIWDHLIGDAK